jgi:hypothetical protein
MQLSVESPNPKNFSHLPKMKFTIENSQSYYTKNIFNKNKKLYLSYLLFTKRVKNYVNEFKLLLYRWKMNVNHAIFNSVLSQMQSDFSFMVNDNSIKENYITLRLSNVNNKTVPQQPVSQGGFVLPFLNIQHFDDLERERKMEEEPVDDYHEANVKKIMKEYQTQRLQHLDKLFKSKSLRMSKVDFSLKLNEVIDEEEEDFHNEFLRKYKKKMEKLSPNFEEDVDDENHRYIVKYDKFEDDDDEKKKNEMTFEEKMAIKKEQQDLMLELVKEDEDDIDLNCDEFDITKLSLLARSGERIIQEPKSHIIVINSPQTENHKTPVSTNTSTVTDSANVTNNVIVETPQANEVIKHSQSQVEIKKEEISPIEETSDSDTSMDELRNFKKSQKKNPNLTNLNKKESYNVAPRYMDFYNKKNSAKVENTKAVDSTRLMKVISFSKKLAKKGSALK